jgi:hypothetical protein
MNAQLLRHLMSAFDGLRMQNLEIQTKNPLGARELGERDQNSAMFERGPLRARARISAKFYNFFLSQPAQSI